MIFECGGRAVVTGLGKSGLIGRKISATLSSMGTPSVFLHAGGGIARRSGNDERGDVVLAVSQSGETEELLALLEQIKRLGIRLVTMTGNVKFDAGDGQRRGAGYCRERGSVLAESGADCLDDSGAGDGRCAGDCTARPARILRRGFRGIASGGEIGIEAASRWKL